MNTPKNTSLLYRSILGNPPEPPVNTSKTQDKPKPSKSIHQWIREGLSVVDKPTKKNKPKGKPINGYDRLNALARIPRVQRELEAIEKEVDKKKKIELELRFFKNYEVPPNALKHSELFYKYKHYSDFNTIYTFNNFDKSDVNFISKYRDGKHIIIAVDMSRKRQEIEREFKQVLTRINKDYKIPKGNTRDSKTTQNIWDIYDYCKKDKLNFRQIARKPLTKDDSRLESHVKQVGRAYKKAENIIKDIMQIIKEDE